MKETFKDIQPSHILMLTVAGIVNAFGITIFLYPVNLYDSGISGTSMLLAQISPRGLTLSLYLIVLNISLFIYGYKKQGLIFTVYSVYAVTIYSVMSYLITYVFPIDVTFTSPLAGQDLLLCAIFGGAISGLGSGLVIRYGGAIDGIEVLAVIFAKRIGISVGTFVMIYNVILYVIAGIKFGSFILPLYSIITYFVALKVVDFIVEGIDREKSAMIITTKDKAISEALMVEFGSGSTIMDARGGYSNSKKKIIYFVVNRFQITKLKRIVQRIDPKAYITITEVADVFSQNM
ncbi:MAG: YitT family protein [Catonella sp.]|nr:YitT family protein [Catonella sp.]MDY6357170.1 YitT family protein [Catonella sp.]